MFLSHGLLMADLFQFGLACDDWKQTLVGTVHSFGNMLGLLIQGQISDRYTWVAVLDSFVAYNTQLLVVIVLYVYRGDKQFE